MLCFKFHPGYVSNPAQQCYGNQMAFMNQYVPQNINPQLMYWNPTLLNNNNLQLQLQNIGLRNDAVFVEYPRLLNKI